MWQGTLACKTTFRIVQAATDKCLAFMYDAPTYLLQIPLQFRKLSSGKNLIGPVLHNHQRDRLLDGVQAGLLDGASVSSPLRDLSFSYSPSRKHDPNYQPT